MTSKLEQLDVAAAPLPATQMDLSVGSIWWDRVWNCSEELQSTSDNKENFFGYREFEPDHLEIQAF